MSSNGAAQANDKKANVLVVRGWGSDSPGVVDSLMKVVVSNNCQVLDMAQFLIGGSLVFTFVIQVDDQKSMKLMKDFQDSAKQRDLKLNFHIPEADADCEASGRDNEAVIVLVSGKDITPSLLAEIDSVLFEHQCVVHEIEHRSDNMLENNGEFNKVQIRISCPPGLKLGALVMGAPKDEGGSSLGIQKVAWSHGCEVTARWCDAMNRPNGKSLVIFGLSNVLCPSDVLDEVLIEAGLDPQSVVPPPDGTSSVPAGVTETQKLAMLKGHSAQLVQKVAQRLEFTPGAKLVCAALKRMGFRIAILTNTGMKGIAEHAKAQLGVDYAICREVEVVDGCFTGQYTGELSDVKFRKADLLKLIAEREGIDYRNVITVGEALKGLKAANARLMLETFGPNIFFNSLKLKDLTIALYLLGFNGSDVRTLRKRRWEEGPGDKASEIVAGAPYKRFMVQVSSQSRSAGQLQRIFGSLGQLRSSVQLSTVRQCSLQDGGMCIGFDMRVFQANPDEVLKGLLFTCQKEGFQVLEAKDKVTDWQLAKNWKDRYKNRYVVTLVKKPTISSLILSEVLHALSTLGVSVVRIERLSIRSLAALQFVVSLPDGLDTEKFKSLMCEVSKNLGADIAIQADDLERWMRRLVVFDMDSTLIQQEVIDELAKLAGVEQQVKEITEAAMRGELDFFGSLKSRVALLKGHNAEELFAKVIPNLIYTPGAKRLCTCLRRLGYKMAVISGGFLPVAQVVQKHLGLDYAFANTLEVDETSGLLTGRTSGPVVTPQRKRALLATIANVEGCEIQQTIAVGDGANDIPMLHASGLGIAFCAKPKVQEVSKFRINQMDLSTVLFLIGVSERAMERLASGAEV